MKKLISAIAVIVLMLLTLTANAKTVAYWRLEEGTAGSTHTTDLDNYFVDSSSYSNNLSTWYYPAPVSAVPPGIPQGQTENKIALNFCRRTENAVGGVMCLSTHNKPIDSQDFSGGFTIECAMKNRTYDWNAVISKNGKPVSTSPFNPFKLIFRYDPVGDARFNFEFLDGGSNVQICTSTFPYKLDEWYWVACVCNGAEAWLYVKEPGDAGYDLEQHITGVVDGLIPYTSAWAIARGTWDGNDQANPHYGSIDEVRICDTALAPNQFLAASGGAAVSPVAYWRFEEGTNGVHQANADDYYVDSSGNGNHMATDITPILSTASSDVPFATVPQIGKADTMSRVFTPDVQNIGTFGAETGGSKPIESMNLDSFTVECMAKASGIGWQGIVTKDGEPSWNINGWVDPSFVIKFRGEAADNHKIQVAFFDETTNFVECWSSFNYTPGKWYQIAAVFNEFTGTASLYIKKESDADYILEDSKTTTWAGTPIVGGLIDSDYPWAIGRGMHWGQEIDGFNGNVDEIRISDTALDPSQFLGNIMNTNPVPPIINNAEFLPYPTPTENDGVTVQAAITVANATITNVTLNYKINGGSYISVPMTTNTSSSIYSADIPAQAADSVVDFIIEAVNSGGQMTSSTSKYDVVQSMDWDTILVANDTYFDFASNLFSMAIKSDGLAGFVYSSYASNKAMYVEEDSLGSLKAPVAITADRQGSYSDLKYGTDDEPRVALANDVGDGGGVTYVQRSGGTWTTPIIVITNLFGECRNVMTLVDNAPSVLWYENYQAGGYAGKLATGNPAGDTFTSVDVTVPPFPNYPGDLRLPFAMATDSNGKRCIALHGPGWGVDLLYYGVEDGKGSGNFDWEEIPISLTHSNVYADQIGFSLDNLNNPYIVLHDYNTNPACAALFYKTGSSWMRQYLGPQGHWNRSAVAYDPWNDCMWVVHNTEIVPNSTKDNHLLRLWSNRSGSWKTEQLVTNGIIVETFAGLQVTSNGVIKLAYTPFVNSPQLIYMYSTTFSDIPEPGVIIGGIALALLAFRKMK